MPFAFLDPGVVVFCIHWNDDPEQAVEGNDDVPAEDRQDDGYYAHHGWIGRKILGNASADTCKFFVL